MEALDGTLIGESPAMVALRAQIEALLTDGSGRRRLPPLLITGETGTGKGLVARLIHRRGPRANGEFVEVNGAAIPDHLLESELFGYERGAFTDARQPKPGLLHVAHRGTLFLDEIALLSMPLQAKLLKVLEDDSVRRLGATRSEPVDVSIISATNEDLGHLIQAKRFREDLFHRLAVITLAVPPLRERGDDIVLLADHAVARASAKHGGPHKRLSADAHAVLRRHRWPGNVRELNSVVERAVLLCPDAVIPPSALNLEAAPAPEDAESERRRLGEVLAETGWNISRTAAILGITRNTVRARAAKYGMRPDVRDEPAPESRTASPVVEDMPPPAPGVRGPSIAVLPFHVEGGGEAETYFGDGIVEAVVRALASVRELLVISHSSTLRYRGARVDVCDVGRQLGVSYAASGSVRRAGTRLRVSVELAETTRGAVVWASHFDGLADDLFALQDQIATRVVATLAPQVRQTELRRALAKHPENLQAYDCLLRGLAQIYRLNREDFADARTWLEKAIDLDPGYAAPYALLAIWHTIRFGQGWSPDPAADQEEVVRFASLAIERDSFDAMALALSGHAKAIMLYEFDAAIALFDRALTASPNSAVAWVRSSPTYSYLGDAREAIRRAEQGLRLSPFDPHIFYVHTILGLARYVAGDYDEAVRWGRKAKEENPRFTANLRLFTAELAALGRIDEAREVARELLAVEPRFQVGRFVERYALRDPARRAALARHLRLAGLPG